MVFTLFLYVTLAWLLGVLAFLVIPFVVESVPVGRERLATHYYSSAMTVLGRGLIVARSAGGLDLVRRQYDAKYDAEECVLNGETLHIGDNKDAFGRLHGKPFGLALEELAMGVRPVHAEIGRRLRDAAESDQLRGLVDVDGQQVQGLLRTVPVSLGPTAVQLTDVKHLSVGSASPRDGEQAQEYTEISQEQFHERISAAQTMALLTGLAGGAGVVWFLKKYGSSAPGGGGGGVTQPIMLNASPLVDLVVMAV